MIGEEVMVPSTEADQLRQQLLHAQKLSSVGALASSVAHEFNNILTTIINYARLAMRTTSDEAGRTQAIERILKGSQRAATLVNSMLGFARNHSSQRQVTDMAALLEEVLILTEKDLSKHRVPCRKTLPWPTPGLGGAQPDRAGVAQPDHQRPPGHATRGPSLARCQRERHHEHGRDQDHRHRLWASHLIACA